MKAYKVEILIIDFDEMGLDEIKSVITNARYPNHCMSPDVKAIQEYDIGEWSDEHPLNLHATADQYYNNLVAIDHEQELRDNAELVKALDELSKEFAHLGFNSKIVNALKALKSARGE